MTLEDFDTPPAATSKYVTGYGTCSGRNGCGAEWVGHRIEHCIACHQTFSGSTTGDAHRVGPHDPRDGRRRCLDASELEALGLWTDDRGVWHGSPNKAGKQHRRKYG